MDAVVSDKLLVPGWVQARSVVACIMPLFTTTMFVKLGWGWGGTLIACIAIVGIPAPMIVSIVALYDSSSKVDINGRCSFSVRGYENIMPSKGSFW